MSPGNDDYLQKAKEAFAGMSPEGRVRYGRYLGQKAQRQGHDFIDLNQDGIDDRLQDPNFLAQKTTQIHQEQPGLLSQIFGGLFGGHRRHHRRHHSHHDRFDGEDLFEGGEDEGGFFEGVGDFFGGDD